MSSKDNKQNGWSAFFNWVLGYPANNTQKYNVESNVQKFTVKAIPVEPKYGTIEEFGIEEPVTTIVEESIVEEPIVEKPIVEEPIVEEPIVEEPIVEEPIVEEPIVE